MDFRRNSVDHPPLTIDNSTVERVSSTKFLGVHITENLTWTTNNMSLSKKAQQHLHILRRLKSASLPPPILTTFYCPSPQHPGYFPYTMLQQSQYYRDGPHPSVPQSLSAPTIRKTVPENQSPLHQNGQQIFPSGFENPELKSHRPSLKPHTNPLPPETWTISPPPTLTTSQKKKTVKPFCAIQSVLHTGEWACINHL